MENLAWIAFLSDFFFFWSISQHLHSSAFSYSLTWDTFRNTMYCKLISGTYGFMKSNQKAQTSWTERNKASSTAFFVVCRATRNMNWTVAESMILNHFLICGCCQSPAKEWPQKKEEKWRTEGASCCPLHWARRHTCQLTHGALFHLKSPPDTSPVKVNGG